MSAVIAFSLPYKVENRVYNNLKRFLTESLVEGTTPNDIDACVSHVIHSISKFDSFLEEYGGKETDYFAIQDEVKSSNSIHITTTTRIGLVTLDMYNQSNGIGNSNNASVDLTLEAAEHLAMILLHLIALEKNK